MFVNGEKVGKEKILNHLDRLVFGSSAAFLLIFPVAI